MNALHRKDKIFLSPFIKLTVFHKGDNPAPSIFSLSPYCRVLTLTFQLFSRADKISSDLCISLLAQILHMGIVTHLSSSWVFQPVQTLHF